VNRALDKRPVAQAGPKAQTQGVSEATRQDGPIPAAARFQPGASSATRLDTGLAGRLRQLTLRSRGRDAPDAPSHSDGPDLTDAAEMATLHTDADAAEAAELVSAEAFTLGRDIYFAAGRYRPGTASGDQLLRHELRHVAQAFGSSAPEDGAATPPAAPTGPPSPPHAVASETHPLERAVTDGLLTPRAPFDTGLILRFPSYIPPTPGGQALRRWITPQADDDWDTIYARVSSIEARLEGESGEDEEENETATLPELDPYERAEDEDIAVLAEDLTADVHASFSLVNDDAVSADLRLNFDSDMSTLVYEIFYEDETQDFPRNEETLNRVAQAYFNLVHLYQYEQGHPDAVSPYRSPMENWWETRAEVFRSAAIDSYSGASLYGILAGLAADVAAAANGDPSGPVAGARALIGSLFEHGISDNAMDAVAELYRTVMSGLDPVQLQLNEENDMEARLSLMQDIFASDLKNTVMYIEERLVAERDEARTAEFRQRLADEIADYLATVREDGFTDDTEIHLAEIQEIIDEFGGDQTILLFIANNWLPVGEDLSELAEDLNETAEEAPADAAPERTLDDRPDPEPVAEEAVCEGEEIGLFEIGEWLRMYETDMLSFFVRWYDVNGLICANRPYTDEPGSAEVTTNLSDMTGEAIRIMRSLRRQKNAARQRADRIVAARTGLGEDLLLLDDAEEPRYEPDYVSLLNVDNSFYTLFDQALRYGSSSFDVASEGEALDFTIQDHFQALAYYQISLRDAATLWRDLDNSGIAAFLRARDAERYGPALNRMQNFTDNEHDYPDWPEYRSDIDNAQTIDFAVIMLQGIAERARAERDIETLEDLQREVFDAVAFAIPDIAVQEHDPDDEYHSMPDFIRLSDIWPDPIQSRLPDTWRQFENETEAMVGAAINMVNQGRMADLLEMAAAASARGDSLQSSQLLQRFEALEADFDRAQPGANEELEVEDREQRELIEEILNQNSSAEALEGLRAENLLATNHLLQIFLLAESAMQAHGQAFEMPGRVIQQHNLLAVMLRRSSSKTLAGAMAEMRSQEFFELAWSVQMDEEDIDQFLADGTPGPLDELESGFNQVGSMAFSAGQLGRYGLLIDNARQGLEDSAASGTLGLLLEAEAAGGIEDRRPKLVELADLLRENQDTPSLSIARFIYADVLGVADLIDPLGMPPDVRDAETRFNFFHTGTPAEGYTPEQLEEDRATIEAYDEEKEGAFHQLDEGRHPRTGEFLTTEELDVYDKYCQITGHKSLLPGELGISEAKDFAKNVLKMIVVLAVTRGIGARVGAATGSSRLAYMANMGAFTAAMRFDQTLTTGRYPHRGFIEDFIINVASDRIGQASRLAYMGAFGLPQTAARQGLRHSAGMFVSELVVSGAATVQFEAMSAAFHGRSFTRDEARDAFVSNAAFMVALSGAHVMGDRASALIARRLENAQTEHRVANEHLEALQREMEAADADIHRAAEDLLNKTTDAERQAVLTEQVEAMRRKLRIMQRSKNPELRMLAESYRLGIEAHYRRTLLASTHIRINARPVPDTSNFTYDRGPMSERALLQYLQDSGHPYEVVQLLDGKAFVVTLPDGTRTRYRPRPAAPEGGTRRGAFSDIGRLEGDEISADDPAALMDILLDDSLIHETIAEGAGSNRITIGTGDFAIRAEIVPAEQFSGGDTRHMAGPASYDIRIGEDGRLHATIEILTNASNDHMVRGANAEVAELARLSTILEAEFGNIRGLNQRQLAEIVAREASAGVLRPDADGSTSWITADDISTIQDFAFLGRRLRELSDRINNSELHLDDLELLEWRRELAMSDLSRLWSEIGLSADATAMERLLEQFSDLGITLDPEVVAYIQHMRVVEASGTSLASPMGILTLQIAFSSLAGANPSRMGGPTSLDYQAYYHDAIGRTARAAYERAIAGGQSEIQAQDAMLEVIVSMRGGTSVASHRGRFFEGLSVEEFNSTASLVAEHGRMYAFELNNHPTYDAVTVKGLEDTGGGYTMQYAVRNDPTTGEPVRHLQLIDSAGNMFFECHRGPNKGLLVTHRNPNYVVKMWSMKARGGLDTFQVVRADAITPDAETHGRNLLSEESAAVLERRVAWYQGEVARLRALDPNHPDLPLTQWRRNALARAHARMQEGISNREMDAMIEFIRSELLDPDAVPLDLPE